MSCTCIPRCNCREAMRQNHGTPEVFRARVMEAVPAYVSIPEATAAAESYQREYDAASEKPNDR